MTRTLYRGGRILADTSTDATALLTQDATIAWLGRDSDAPSPDEVDAVVELEGALLSAAFVDAHVHTTSTGLALTGLDLCDTRSLPEALDRVAGAAGARPGAVLLGHGWDESTWPERRPPTRAELDRASNGAVVYLSRIDVHSCVASSALLAAVPEASGLPGYDPDGWLRQAAHHTVRAAAFAAVTPAQAAAARRATRDHAAALGIGSLHEMGGPDINGADDFVATLRQAHDEPGPLVLGYWGALAGPDLDGVEQARELGARGAAGDLFVDGAIGSRTACLHEPYADADTCGAQYLDTEQVREHVLTCTREGIQAGFHVIGDAATDATLEGFEQAATEVGLDALRSARHRLEHIEAPGERGIEQLARLGVHASVQPLFDVLWGGPDGMYAHRLGSRRAAALNPFGPMIRAGVPLALGSDAPVTPMGPWAAIRAAVFHRVPEHRLTLTQAFVAHTRGGWRSAGDDVSGAVAPGASATLAVWDVEAVDADGLPDVSPGRLLPTCLRTVVEGRTVYRAGDQSPEEVDR